MAKSRANTSVRGGSRASGRWLWGLLAIAGLLAAISWFYRAPITGYAGAGAAYTARVACSCRFIGNRSLDDCARDKLPGMEFISLKEDAEAQSVTARFPLIVSETATYREGYGCVMAPWKD